MDDELKLINNFKPIKFKIDFITRNTAKVLLTNHNMVEGAFYSILAQTDPVYSYKHHKSTSVRPWSFSLFKFYEDTLKLDKNGFSLIEQNKRGYFFLKTIDKRLNQILKEFAESGKILHLGKLELLIEQLNIKNCDIHNVPTNIDTVTIRLETPTFFYNNRTKDIDQLTAETFLKYQCEKFKQFGIMN
ncbi:MAG: hypothetical protein ACFE9T_16485, partial [Promethearchaeota archaeon]